MASIFTQFNLFGVITFFVTTFPYEFMQKWFVTKKEATQKPQSFHRCEWYYTTNSQLIALSLIISSV